MFEEINAIYNHSIKKIKNPYMANRLLSFSLYMMLSIKVNKYVGRIPEWALRTVYFTNIKKRKSPPNIKYQGKAKQIDKKLRQKISTHLCCSERHAIETIKLLRKLKIKPEQYFGLERGE